MPHKLTYTHSKSHISTTIEIDEDANLTEMVKEFELYIKACEYPMSGKRLELVDENL